MRIIFSAVAALVLTASPSFAGGDWGDGYYDGRDYGGYGYNGGRYGRYYDGPAYAYYPAYRPRAYFAPGVYAAPPAYYVPDAYYYGGGNCEIKSKWRHGRYTEKLDCDD